MKLHAHVSGVNLQEPVVLRVAETHDRPPEVRGSEVLLVNDLGSTAETQGFGFTFSKNDHPTLLCLPTELHYLCAGDIIRISPRGDIWVMYRKQSLHNSMLVTERCNSKCLMCSQPPRDVNDDFLIDEWQQAIPLMSPETRELGITGGEPTLHFHRLLQLIETAKRYVPQTSLHMLSNGRLFAYLKYAEQAAALEHPDFMIGIPLYSDLSDRHDFVVQAKGAFAQTVSGILNLGRVKQKVEIRIVLHRFTFDRLPQFARFLARNLPFVSHVALMGLEIMGYTRSNLDALWIDPVDYQRQLSDAVAELAWAGLPVSIYNLPLCLLPQELWEYSRQSISDWKNVYFDECNGCAVRPYCAGFFASAVTRRSKHIRALGETERSFAHQVFGSVECV